MEKGKISVIMGIYNCENTLSEAIDSIVSQTYDNWQLIMCDDCSTDGTYKIAKQYVDEYPKKMILVANKQNRKLAYSLNHCLKYADGEYIARMDADDRSKPERFAKQVKFLQMHPEYDLVGTSMQKFAGDTLLGIEYGAKNPNRYTLRNSNPFNHATILTYKRVYDKLQGYTVSSKTNRAQDYELWFRFYHEGFSGTNLEEPLYDVREDRAAIRRRTFKVRYNAFKLTRDGFRLLNYPKWWIIRPALSMVVKSIVPYFIVDKYRELQGRKG